MNQRIFSKYTHSHTDLTAILFYLFPRKSAVRTYWNNMLFAFLLSTQNDYNEMTSSTKSSLLQYCNCIIFEEEWCI